MSNLPAVTDATFDATLRDADRPVLVDFWAEWCGPCRALTPVLDQLSTELADKLAMVSVNIDDNPELARRYNIMSIPTMLVFRDGQPELSITGARPKAALLASLEPALA